MATTGSAVPPLPPLPLCCRRGTHQDVTPVFPCSLSVVGWLFGPRSVPVKYLWLDMGSRACVTIMVRARFNEPQALRNRTQQLRRKHDLNHMASDTKCIWRQWR